jgi:type VI secretion system protein ImpK
VNDQTLPVASTDPDETMLIPQPGGRRAAQAGMDAPAQSQQHAGANARPSRQAPVIDVASGLNPLLRAANPLLELALPLRTRPSLTDIEALRAQLVQMVRAFEHDARASGIDTERLAAARYCLCTCIDEAISGTPWGSGVWASRSLLVTFHNEASGGERFFLILQRLAQDPAGNVDVLELIYVMLSLGFEGRYRLIDGGRTQLESVRERLERMIRAQRGAFETELSLHWQPVQRTRRRLSQLVPLWVAAALAGVVLAATHVALGVSLNRASDPVFDDSREPAVAARRRRAASGDARRQREACDVPRAGNRAGTRHGARGSRPHGGRDQRRRAVRIRQRDARPRL